MARCLAALLGRHFPRTRLAALQATASPKRDCGGVLTCAEVRLFSLASGEVYDELAQLVGIAWSLA
jgi:hypothetical protein